MEKILKAIFLSSEGDGKIAKTWKGAGVFAITWLLAEFDVVVDEQEATGLINTVIALGAAAYSAYGAFRKVLNKRWSA